jgi:hypothetical protein
MFRWPVLPRVPEWGGNGNRLVERLRELFVEYAKIGRQDQCPPTLRRTMAATQAVSANAATKVTFGTAGGWDTHGYWDATNYRYTPLDYSGYYRVSAKLSFDPMTVTTANRRCAIYVNGAEYSSVTVPQTTGLRVMVLTTDLVALNGSTDYVEVFCIAGDAVTVEAETYRTSLAIEYVGANQIL